MSKWDGRNGGTVDCWSEVSTLMESNWLVPTATSAFSVSREKPSFDGCFTTAEKQQSLFSGMFGCCQWCAAGDLGLGREVAGEQGEIHIVSQLGNSNAREGAS